MGATQKRWSEAVKTVSARDGAGAQARVRCEGADYATAGAHGRPEPGAARSGPSPRIILRESEP